MTDWHHVADYDRECRHCGRHVTRTFARVHGDGDDVAHRCLGCDCFRRISRGSAAGLELDMPDPRRDAHANRNRGRRVAAPNATTVLELTDD